MTTIKLTEKGKDIYGDYESFLATNKSDKYGYILYVLRKPLEDNSWGDYEEFIIASNPAELKALIDLGLVTIE